MSESHLTLTFTEKTILQSSLVDSSGVQHYTIATTTGLRGREVTTITAAGHIGEIGWAKEEFEIGSDHFGWDSVRSEVGSGGERQWKWGDRGAYLLKYVNSDKDLLVGAPKYHCKTKTIPDIQAIPTSGSRANPARFTAASNHLLHSFEPATITFPLEMQAAQERLFVLMAILQTETMRTDKVHGSGRSAAIDALSLFN
ncbi:hypothetical protein C8R47DRAFT_1259821 [Mycena vitilis]|nr:hypothetical protein C8R47DRAFT_1259821 [Mycena vitilis]